MNDYEPNDQFPPIEGNNTRIAGPLIFIFSIVIFVLVLIF
jgi:hypothetical protein